jgi:hypothetical protein
VTHDELAERHREALARNWRTMVDRDGRVPQRLLDELASIADQHAIGENLQAVERTIAKRTRRVPAGDGSSTP